MRNIRWGRVLAEIVVVVESCNRRMRITEQLGKWVLHG